MAQLDKQTVISKVEILPDETIQVREAIQILEDGNVIAQTYHRYVVRPGDDLAGKQDKIKSIANLLWSDEVVTKHKTAMLSANSMP